MGRFLSDMKKFLFLSVAIVLLTGCTMQHKAESMADNFLEANAKDLSEMQSRHYLDLDSTRLITDSVLHALRQSQHPHLSATGDADITYKGGQMLYLLPMRYTCKGEDCRMTFYLDQQMQHVMAVK